MSDQPPPYIPHPPIGPSAPGFPSAFNPQPSAFPASPYQTFPQTSGGDPFYYQGQMGQMGPGHMPNPGPFLVQPGFQGYQSEPPGPCHSWGNPKTYGQPDKNTMFVVDQNCGSNSGGGGAEKSCLAACSAALCCCCLWDLLTHNFC
ncbi:cysteine-rich and transmembrane domain-containing protein 1-like [Acanthopagrus latus]|uniref:cysteine-rich and transmembrane domain-containing protein 1-like n=1 Tax=Acanthopagrus latus TaxID=8177 RepID=UPI00187BE959|nr:cysteine-rich and transmembrane domain-containing protein 1-like [Acanthopagrus latus]